MAHITTTGNAELDSATSEIASALRHASPGTVHGPLPDQYFYDEAMRLRDAIMNGTREMDAPEPPLENFTVASRNRTPCSECGGGYWQPYIGRGGDEATDEYIPHARSLCY